VEARFLADADLNHRIVTGLERLDPEMTSKVQSRLA
jgi:hypothetical protein